LGELERLHDRFGEDVAFFIVYIREAHPEDGWVLEENRDEGVVLTDPKTMDERADAAAVCAVGLRTAIPMLLDDTGDTVAAAYGGWPDRLYLIGRDGRVAFRSEVGPQGFLPQQLEAAIERELATTRT
jgi:hypothetical protein